MERGGLGALKSSAGAPMAHAGRQAQGAFPGIRNPLALLEPHLAGSSRMAEAGQKIEQGSASSEADDLSVPEAVSHVWGMLRGHAQRALKELRAPK